MQESDPAISDLRSAIGRADRASRPRPRDSPGDLPYRRGPMVLRVGLSLALLCMAASATGQKEGELPAVARPRFSVGDEQLGSGTVFFVRVPDEVGVAAVGTAHSFDLRELSQTREVEFLLGNSKRRVAVASRFYTQPGHSFTAPGATLRDDFIVFALDAPPFGIRVLEPEIDGPDLENTRVRILGVPAAIPQDEDDIFGRVRSATHTRLEVELDVPGDLRGWGGAPVLRSESSRPPGRTERRCASEPRPSVRSSMHWSILSRAEEVFHSRASHRMGKPSLLPSGR